MRARACADKLAESDFEPQLRYLLTALPSRKQTLAFSATYPPDLLAKLRAAMRSPHEISVIKPDTANVHDDRGGDRRGAGSCPGRIDSCSRNWEERDPLFDDEYGGGGGGGNGGGGGGSGGGDGGAGH
eukprot:3231620-Pleurochrysis_carterae.AAC.1